MSFRASKENAAAGIDTLAASCPTTSMTCPGNPATAKLAFVTPLAFARTLAASIASTTPASATARFVTPPLSGEPSQSSATAEMVRSCPSASKCTVSLGRTRRTGR